MAKKTVLGNFVWNMQRLGWLSDMLILVAGYSIRYGFVLEQQKVKGKQ